MDRFHYHVGPSLEVYAVRMAECQFRTVQVLRASSTAHDADVDFLLTPTVRKLEVTSFAWAWEKQHITIDVEWIVKARSEAPPLWIATSSGNATGQLGSLVSGFKDGQVLIQDMVADLWKQTDQSFRKLRDSGALK